MLAPGAAGLYYNRNRMYSPSMGRFIQRDPNETAMPALTALASNGDAMFILLEGFNSAGLYGDGMNLYEYVGSNPLNRRDPLGLYDDFDEAMDEITGHRVASLGYINSASGWALVGMNATVDLIGGILGISDLYELGKNAMNGEMDVWDFVTAASLVAGPASRAGVAVFKAFRWCWTEIPFSVLSSMGIHSHGVQRVS
ncbi:MAG: RHS repeat-associated core domain-containing protein [Phycisphaerales bacterium]|nr:RHS repeat-associated core domain-containing protein [Phycisphaerales bacterium]